MKITKINYEQKTREVVISVMEHPDKRFCFDINTFNTKQELLGLLQEKVDKITAEKKRITDGEEKYNALNLSSLGN